MGDPSPDHRESMERLRGITKFGKWLRSIKDGASFVGGRHVSHDTNWTFRAVMTRHGVLFSSSQGDVSTPQW